MENFCPYCHTLHSAFRGENYCSNLGDSIADAKSNAFYFKSNNLSSGNHISRLSIRSVSNGYQQFKINNRDFVLDKNHYLLVNEGDQFESDLDTNSLIEGIVVAFNPNDAKDITYNYQQSETNLLDDPFQRRTDSLELNTQSILLRSAIQQTIHKIKEGIQSDLYEPLYYEQLFYDLIEEILTDQYNLKVRIENLKAKKKSTKEEIFRRVNNAKSFMDSELATNISLNTLGKVSTMSPYHFLRSFKVIYHLTPHQYLTNQRIERAKFLLVDSDLEINEIVGKTGFHNKSSFCRLFKSKTQLSPLSFRIAKRSI